MLSLKGLMYDYAELSRFAAYKYFFRKYYSLDFLKRWISLELYQSP